MSDDPKKPTRAEQQRAARELLESLETDGASAKLAPPGMRLVPLSEAAIFVPRTAKPNHELRLARGIVDWNNGQPSFNRTAKL